MKYGTLRRWLNDGIWTQPDWEVAGGGRPLLSPEVEEMFAMWLIGNAEIGFPIKRRVALIYVHDLLVQQYGAQRIKSNNHEGWLKGFLKRNKKLYTGTQNKDKVLKVRNCAEGLSVHRALSLTPENIKGYQDNCIAPFLKEHPEIKLDRVGGFDEFQYNINSAITTGKVITPNGLLYTVTPKEHDEHMTVLGGYVGTWATPILVIFKGVELKADWLQLLPEDHNDMIVVGVSKNGWITPELKHAWYCHVRSHPDFPEPLRPVFWQFDGHFTNYEPDLIITAAAWLSSQNGPTIIKKGIDAATVLPEEYGGPNTTNLFTRDGRVEIVARNAAPRFMDRIVYLKSLRGDFFTVLPSHSTHGCQAMDCKGDTDLQTKPCAHTCPAIPTRSQIRLGEAGADLLPLVSMVRRRAQNSERPYSQYHRRSCIKTIYPAAFA